MYHEFQVLVVLNSVKNATAWLKENKHPDIIFMDIKLRDGNCFEIFDKVKELGLDYAQGYYIHEPKPEILAPIA